MRNANTVFSYPTLNSTIPLCQSVMAFVVVKNGFPKMMGAWLRFLEIFKSTTTKSIQNWQFFAFTITSSNFPYGSLIHQLVAFLL